MPRLIDIAREVLGETVSNILNCENCHSVDDFLLNYETIRKANQHTVGEQVEYYKPSLHSVTVNSPPYVAER